MSHLFISLIAKPIGRLGASIGQAITDFKPFALGLGAAASTYGLTTAYLYDVGLSTGASMEPTIPNATNWLGVNKTYRKGKGIQIGDCVQVVSPQQPGIMAGKRVVGMPGDYILRSRDRSATPGGAPMLGVTDWKRRLAIDSLQRDETNVAKLKGGDGDDVEGEWEEPEMIQVPEGHVWLEGDNLAWSRDSRVYGPVPMALIRGRSSWYCDGPFSWVSLRPGRGLRRVETWEMDAVLGETAGQATRPR